MSFVFFSLFALTLLFPHTANSESSFSALGYGLQNCNSGARSSGFGYLSVIGSDSLGINLNSPATWQGPATARLGIHGNYSRTETSDVHGSNMSDLFGLSGIGIAIPVGFNSYFGITLNPYTRMDYNWTIEETNSTSGYTTTRKHHGRGGLSQGLIAFSIPVRENLRIGISGRAIFGKTDRRWEIDFNDLSTNNTSRTFSDRYKGVGFSFSMNYENIENGWMGGFVFNTPLGVQIQRQELIMSGRYVELDSTFDLDEKFDLPADLVIGFGKKYNRHSFGFETSWHGWNSDMKPELNTSSFVNAFRFSLGWEWIPDYRLYDPIWETMTYRSGIYILDNYSEGSFQNQASKIGITSGLGVPYNNGHSRIDIGLDLNILGNESDDGVNEKSAVLTVGFNHSQFWFVKRQRR